jgi:hypothetical protein
MTHVSTCSTGLAHMVTSSKQCRCGFVSNRKFWRDKEACWTIPEVHRCAGGLGRKVTCICSPSVELKLLSWNCLYFLIHPHISICHQLHCLYRCKICCLKNTRHWKDVCDCNVDEVVRQYVATTTHDTESEMYFWSMGTYGTNNQVSDYRMNKWMNWWGTSYKLFGTGHQKYYWKHKECCLCRMHLKVI